MKMSIEYTFQRGGGGVGCCDVLFYGACHVMPGDGDNADAFDTLMEVNTLYSSTY